MRLAPPVIRAAPRLAMGAPPGKASVEAAELVEVQGRHADQENQDDQTTKHAGSLRIIAALAAPPARRKQACETVGAIPRQDQRSPLRGSAMQSATRVV